jgi:hypothetical protein
MTLSKNEARLSFLELVHRYGLHWGANVPSEAYARMTDISKILSADDKRDALKAGAVTAWLKGN